MMTTRRDLPAAGSWDATHATLSVGKGSSKSPSRLSPEVGIATGGGRRSPGRAVGSPPAGRESARPPPVGGIGVPGTALSCARRDGASRGPESVTPGRVGASRSASGDAAGFVGPSTTFWAAPGHPPQGQPSSSASTPGSSERRSRRSCPPIREAGRPHLAELERRRCDSSLPETRGRWKSEGIARLRRIRRPAIWLFLDHDRRGCRRTRSKRTAGLRWHRDVEHRSEFLAGHRLEELPVSRPAERPEHAVADQDLVTILDVLLEHALAPLGMQGMDLPTPTHVRVAVPGQRSEHRCVPQINSACSDATMMLSM